MKRRLRFSLLTLLLSVLLIGSATALWLHWEPWVLQATVSSLYPIDLAYFSADEDHIVSESKGERYFNEIHIENSHTGVADRTSPLPPPVDPNALPATGIFTRRPVALYGDGWDLCIYDLESPENSKTLTGSKSTINAVALSPDGLRVAAGCEDGSVHLWDEHGKHLKSITTRRAKIRSLALSNGGKRVVASFADIGAGAWDCETGKPLIAYLEKMSSIVDISPDGSRALFFRWKQPAAVGEPSETYHLWDLNRDKELRQLLVIATKPLQSTQFSPDGARFVSMQVSDHRLIDAMSGQDVAEFNPNALAITFTADSQTIAVTDAYGTALYDAAGGARLVALPEKIRSMDDLWRAAPKAVPTRINSPKIPPLPQFTADGRRLLAVMSDGRLSIWKRMRPERWWGLAWLPEFWTTLVLAGLLAANTIRNWRRGN